MAVLEGIEPARVFHFFEEICGIPHGSGNIGQISNYLKKFAADRGLYCIQDEVKNIIIIKEATAGYEKEEPFILQGHMDMVTVKTPDCDIDMEKEPLRLRREGNTVYAEGTSLGGDDGIAVAYSLALLDTEDIPHPRLEVVLTVNEETGMDGAMAIDLSMLQGRRMLNLDSEEEGILLTSCAGGARADVHIPVTYENLEVAEKWISMELTVKGLAGGHSGTEIIREGGNANCLLGRALYEIGEKIDLRISAMEGGLADNAIPREARAIVLVKEAEQGILQKTVDIIQGKIQTELGTKDPEAVLELVPGSIDGFAKVLSNTSAKTALSCLLALPNGVQAMSADVEGLVETSLNLGIMRLNEQELVLSYAVRSSVNSAKEALCEKMQAIAYLAGAKVDIRSAYPGWAYSRESKLREKMVRIYEKMYGKKPEIQAIHAGLECGILADKIKGLDCISLGPDMHNVHTTEESLDIASVESVWKYLLAVLADKE